MRFLPGGSDFALSVPSPFPSSHRSFSAANKPHSQCTPKHGPSHSCARSRAVAGGHTVRSWAKHRDVGIDIARGLSDLPEFRQRVDNCRLNHADRMVGKVAGHVAQAIDRLAELSQNADKTTVSLAATKALIEDWVGLSVHFDQTKKLEDMRARVKASREARPSSKAVGIRVV